MRPVLREFLSRLPPVQHAFAYGSGVFHQPQLYAGQRGQPMLDLIVAVDNPVQWHDQNLRLNSPHYSFLRYLGASAVCSVADRVGVGVYFNTLVPFNDQVVKYGVMGTAALKDDLLTWRHLYVAGRLQKPVLPLVTDAQLAGAAHSNTHAALAAALLCMPATWSLRELLLRVCALSYTGDVRMGLAEDSRKVQRIVDGSYPQLEGLYAPLLQGPLADGGGVQPAPAAQKYLRSTSKEATANLLAALPQAVLQRIAQRAGVRTSSAVAEQLHDAPDCAQLALLPNLKSVLQRVLARTVGISSRRQAVAGLLSAGPWKSVKYLRSKLAKAWR